MIQAFFLCLFVFQLKYVFLRNSITISPNWFLTGSNQWGPVGDRARTARRTTLQVKRVLTVLPLHQSTPKYVLRRVRLPIIKNDIGNPNQLGINSDSLDASVFFWVPGQKEIRPFLNNIKTK